MLFILSLIFTISLTIGLISLSFGIFELAFSRKRSGDAGSLVELGILITIVSYIILSIINIQTKLNDQEGLLRSMSAQIYLQGK